jgi:ABC-type transporter Mla subunit MlaD
MIDSSATVYTYRDRIAVLESQLDHASLERQTFVDHLARQERRNELLQDALDDAVERVSGLQAQIMDLAADNTRLLAAVGAASVAVVAAAVSPSPETQRRLPRAPQLRPRPDGLHWRTAELIARFRAMIETLPTPFAAYHLAAAAGCHQRQAAEALRLHAAALGVHACADEDRPATGRRGKPCPFYRRAEVAATA